MNPDQLHQLLILSDARKTQALAALERVAAEDRKLAAEIDRITAMAGTDFDISSAGVPPKQLGLRLAWVDQSVRLLNRKRDALAPEIQRLRREATLLLGKHEALDELTSRADAERAQDRARRAEAETPFISPEDI